MDRLLPPSARHSFARPTSISLLALAIIGGCSTNGPGAGSSPRNEGGGQSGGAAGAGGGSVNVASSDTLPARIRRLTNAEYDASVRVLLGVTDAPSVKFSFPPDAKQGPHNAPAGAAFTVNDAQRVDPVLADKLDTAALAIVAQARMSDMLNALAPCGNAEGADGEACAQLFIQSFGAKAYRRALSNDERAGLLDVYHLGADGHTYAEGIDQVTRVLLQSPGFLYTTELGDAGAGAAFVMTADEIATALSYLLTTEPPNSGLLDSAASGSLTTAAGRELEARRLLATPAGRERLVRVVREWLGIDDVARREKSQGVYPEFAGVSAAMEEESRAFIKEVLNNSTGTLGELLTAPWTIADATLAGVYGVKADGSGQRTSLADVRRRGILNQGAFLSVFASNNGSHPVFRGVAFLRRIACIDLPDPGSQGLVVSFPPTDPTKTTRSRFESHALDARCVGCHAKIDGVGFLFEGFDGMGKARTTENGLPIDTKATVSLGSDFDGTYADSMELVSALAQSDSVKTCMARHIFHSTVGRSDASIAGAELGFVEAWKQLPVDDQGKLEEVLVAFIKSPTFVQRRTP